MKKNVLILFGLITTLGLQGQIVKTQIGATRYDLQTNSSIERRVAVDPTTGHVIVCYTGSSDLDDGAGAFASRGTGYAYWNTTNWKDAQNNTLTPPVTSRPPKPESTNDRTGWPSIIMLAGGAEAFVAHRASSNAGNGLVFGKRNSGGTGSWNLTSASIDDVTWPRMAANSGDSIVLITSTLNGTLFNMKGGVAFKRSFDGGKTWTPDSSKGFDSIPGINENVYGGATCAINGDEYSLDVRGKMIAILTGGLDVTLYKSVDFGTTWTKTTLIVGDNVSGSAQSFDDRSGGDYSVLIDNNDKVHCFWGRNYNDGASIITQNAGIMYWSENMPAASKPTLLTKTFYLKDGIHSLTNVPRWTAIRRNNGGDEQRSYNKNHVSHPSSGIDASGNIYLSFMRLRGVSDTNRYVAGKQRDAAGMILNDVYLLKSTDGGTTWIGPLNVSNSDSMESAYPSIARHVGSDVHMVYQEDTLYGFCISNTAVSHAGVATNNKLIYAKIPVADIVTPTDITPPLLQRSDSFQTRFPTGSLRFVQGCNKEINSSLTLTNWKSFVETYIATAFDNVTTSGLLILDTPSGIKLNIAGTYPLIIYARDAAGNISDNWNKIPLTSGDTAFYDKIILSVIVDPSTGSVPTLTFDPPYETKAKRTVYLYLGTPFSIPGGVTAKSGNPCGGGTLSPVAPTASSIDVNTIGEYNLVWTVTEGSSTIKDTIKVFVGTEPNPSVSEETVNTATKKLNAKGEESDTMTFAKTTYQWKYKIGSTAAQNFGSATTRNLVNYTIAPSVTKFDSICLEVSNLYNSAPHNKAKKITCNALKYTLSITNISASNLKVEIYPNPNNGVFYIKVNNPMTQREAKVNIHDNLGKTVLSEVVKLNSSGVITMQNDNLAKGTYLITTEIGNRSSTDLIEIK
jgi:hypothetical protein